MVNNAVMQFADRAFLARESMASLEASLPASMLSFIVLGFFQSVVAYSGTFVAQYHGAGDARRAALSYRAGNIIALASGAAALAFAPLGSFVFDWVGANGEVLWREKTYYAIVTAGGVFLFLQMAASAYFTGRGMTRLVFAVNLGGNVLNLAIDPLLIFGWGPIPAFGITGAAAATVASTAVQWAALAYAARREERRQPGTVPARELGTVPAGELGRIALRILRFGIPSGGYAVLNILSFTIFVFVTEKVGDVAFAVSNACFSINYLLYAPIEGFAIGAQTLVGQARGRGDDEAAYVAGLRTTALAAGLVAVLVAAVILAHGPILSIFAPPDSAAAAEFHSLGFTLFLMLGAWQVFDATDVAISGALKGAGDTRFVFWWMLAGAFAFWLPLVFLVAKVHNTMPALWATMIVFVAVMCAGSLWRWQCGAWRRTKLT